MEIQDNFGAMILARKFKLWPFRIRNNPPRNQATSQFWRENSNFRIVNLVWFILPKVFLKRRFQICIFTFFLSAWQTSSTVFARPDRTKQTRQKKDIRLKMLKYFIRFCWIVLLIGNLSFVETAGERGSAVSFLLKSLPNVMS